MVARVQSLNLFSICQENDINFDKDAVMMDKIIDTVKLPEAVDCLFGILSVIPLQLGVGKLFVPGLDSERCRSFFLNPLHSSSASTSPRPRASTSTGLET